MRVGNKKTKKSSKKARLKKLLSKGKRMSKDQFLKTFGVKAISSKGGKARKVKVSDSDVIIAKAPEPEKRKPVEKKPVVPEKPAIKPPLKRPEVPRSRIPKPPPLPRPHQPMASKAMSRVSRSIQGFRKARTPEARRQSPLSFGAGTQARKVQMPSVGVVPQDAPRRDDGISRVQFLRKVAAGVGAVALAGSVSHARPEMPPEGEGAIAFSDDQGLQEFYMFSCWYDPRTMLAVFVELDGGWQQDPMPLLEEGTEVLLPEDAADFSPSDGPINASGPGVQVRVHELEDPEEFEEVFDSYLDGIRHPESLVAQGFANARVSGNQKSWNMAVSGVLDLIEGGRANLSATEHVGPGSFKVSVQLR